MRATTEFTTAEYRMLGDFRYQIRRFLHFSEEAARSEGLEPQQHQMLLAIRALGHTPASVGILAEHLLIRHHSAVGLIDRLEERGLVERVRGEQDRRQVMVRLTAEGEASLFRLSSAHREELRNLAPLLAGTLQRLVDE